MTHLTSIDYLVILAYLATTMAIGFWVGSYVRSGSDFFLAGRSLPWWAVGMSLVATDIGGTDLVGVGGDAFRYGMVMGNFEWIGCVPAMLVAAFIFIPHLWRCKVTTIPEYLERRFSVHVRVAVGGVWLVLMACNLGVMLLASAQFMHELANWDLSVSIIGVALLVGIYTWSGGLGAVVYTDVLQGVIMIGGCLMIVVIGIAKLGGIESFIDKVHVAVHARENKTETKPATELRNDENYVEQAYAENHPFTDHLSLVLPVDTKSPGPWPAILFGLALVVSPGYWIGNQCIIQRSLGSKTEYDARASYVYGALLKGIIPFLVVIPGLIALVMFPNLSVDKAGGALPLLVGEILPEGLRGIFVAAFLAALMSSVDSYLNAATTIYVNDFYRRFYRPHADEGQMLLIGRWTTIGFVLWGVYFAYQMIPMGHTVYSLFQTLMSFVVGPTLGVLLAGILSTRTTSKGAFPGFISGLMTSTSLFVLNSEYAQRLLGMGPLFRIDAPYLYYSIWAFLVTVSITAIVSYFGRPDSPEKERYSLWGYKPEEAIE
ncbi:MAG: sodium/solute symporter [Planctomycetes bacterium]|nr:sodium/solute symporter [Planctomycetota bacterium]